MGKRRPGTLMPWIVAVVIGLLEMAGCTQPSVRDLREQPHEVLSFHVPADCETVYQRVVQRARRQYAFIGSPKHQFGVNANLSSDHQSATATLWDSGGIGIRYLLIAEMKALDPANTQINIYVARKRDRQEARLWAGWADTAMED